MFYLYGFVCFIYEYGYRIVYKLFESAAEWIPAIRNKADLSSVQKFNCVTAIADKEIISIFCLSGVLSHHSMEYRPNKAFAWWSSWYVMELLIGQLLTAFSHQLFLQQISAMDFWYDSKYT